jgi:hypothetical protein
MWSFELNEKQIRKPSNYENLFLFQLKFHQNSFSISVSEKLIQLKGLFAKDVCGLEIQILRTSNFVQSVYSFGASPLSPATKVPMLSFRSFLLSKYF